MQCAMVAVAAMGSVGVLRNTVVASVERASVSSAVGLDDGSHRMRPSPLLFLLIVAALMQADHGWEVGGSAGSVGPEPPDQPL